MPNRVRSFKGRIARALAIFCNCYTGYKYSLMLLSHNIYAIHLFDIDAIILDSNKAFVKVLHFYQSPS